MVNEKYVQRFKKCEHYLRKMHPKKDKPKKLDFFAIYFKIQDSSSVLCPSLFMGALFTTSSFHF